MSVKRGAVWLNGCAQWQKARFSARLSHTHGPLCDPPHACVRSMGCFRTFLEADAGNVAICADAVLGGALPIEAVASGTQVFFPTASLAHHRPQCCLSILILS